MVSLGENMPFLTLHSAVDRIFLVLSIFKDSQDSMKERGCYEMECHVDSSV